MNIITTAHRICMPQQEWEAEAHEVIPILMTITAMKIITITMAMTITTTEADTTIPTTATMTFKLTLEEEATEDPVAPHCPEAGARALPEDGPASPRARLWPPAEPEDPEESSRDVEWYVMCGWSTPAVLAGGFETL